MKKKVNALVPAAAVLVILCAAYGLITWHQHRNADELAGQAGDSQIYVTDIQGLTSISWEKTARDWLLKRKAIPGITNLIRTVPSASTRSPRWQTRCPV